MARRRGRDPELSADLRARLLERGTREHYEDAALYDFEYGDRVDDVEWYVALADGLAEELDRPLRLLELGAGTGRITTALLAAGHRVSALDRMAPMLRRLEAKVRDPEARARLEVIEGDMVEPPVPARAFDLVLAPFNALMHLYTHDALSRCFASARRALVGGGTFAFDVMLPDLEWLTLDPSERHSVTYFNHPDTGERLVYSTNHTYDPATQVCHIRLFYDEAPRRPWPFRPPPVPKQLVHLAHRQIYPEELRALLAHAGFTLEEHSGDFVGAPLAEGIESQVVRCRAP